MADKSTRVRRSKCFYGHVVTTERMERKTELDTPIVRLTLEVGEDFVETMDTIVERSKEHGWAFCCVRDAVIEGAMRDFTNGWLRRIREKDANVQDAIQVLERELGPGLVKGKLYERALPHLRAAVS